MAPSSSRSRYRWLVWVLAFAVELAILASMDLGTLVELIPDDSFFYLIIARNFPHAGDFSFDGRGATYGFQPLWQLCLLPFGAWVTSSKGLLLLVLGICSLLHVASAAGIHRLLELLSGRLAGACGAAFWLLNPSILRWFWGIKENGLYALLLVLVLVQTLKWIRGAGDQGIRSALVLGVLLGLTALARVNFVLLAAIVVPLIVLARRHVSGGKLRGRDWSFLGICLAACAAVALPWFVWTKSHFGTLLPTSGLVKLESARRAAQESGVEWLSPGHYLLGLERLPAYLDQSFKLGSGPWGPILLGVVVWQAAAMAVERFRSGSWRLPVVDLAARWLALVVLVLALVNSFATVIALPDFLAYGQWYTVPEYLAQAVLFGLVAAPAVNALRASRLAGGALIGVLLVSCVLWATQRERGIDFSLLGQTPREGGIHPNRMLMRIGRWANEHIDAEQRVGIWDPGIVSYFADKGLISLDPLMNSPDYIRHLQSDQLGYIAAEKISYVCGPAVVRDGSYEFLRLPKGTYEVVWVPFPGEDLGWHPGETWSYVLVRPHGTPGSDFLTAKDFTFGEHFE